MRIRNRRRSQDGPCADPLHQLATLIGSHAYDTLASQGAPAGVILFLGAAQMPERLHPAAIRILYRGGMVNRWALRHPTETLWNIAEDECAAAGWLCARPA
jgi:hypothetical protein